MATSESLQHVLHKLIGLSLEAREAHWNVRGEAFYALHKMFGKIYGALDGEIDTIGERIVQLGELATAALPPDALQLPPVPNCFTLAERLREKAAALSAEARRLVEAVVADDPGTADILTRLSEVLDKQVWMLSATMGEAAR